MGKTVKCILFLGIKFVTVNLFGGKGLEFRHLKDQNNAFMTKIGWGLITKKDAIFGLGSLDI